MAAAAIPIAAIVVSAAVSQQQAKRKEKKQAARADALEARQKREQQQQLAAEEEKQDLADRQRRKAEALQGKVARQRQIGKGGREGTILTETLSGTGQAGADEGRKSLLGI